MTTDKKIYITTVTGDEYEFDYDIELNLSPNEYLKHLVKELINKKSDFILIKDTIFNTRHIVSFSVSEPEMD